MKTVTLLPSCVAQECGMGMIAKDCEERRALPYLFGLAGMLARTHVCGLLLCFVCWFKNKRKERRFFFLPFLLLRALHADLPERARHQSRSQGWM